MVTRRLPELTTCARLPGFMHQKNYPCDNPFYTKLKDFSDEPAYTAEEILKVYPPIDKPHKPSVSGDFKRDHEGRILKADQENIRLAIAKLD